MARKNWEELPSRDANGGGEQPGFLREAGTPRG